MSAAPSFLSRTLHEAFLPLAITGAIALAWCSPARAADVDLPRHPSLSPDGSELVFSFRGDLWKVASEGGQAVRLTAHPSANTESAWSPDGTQIVFVSDRGSGTNLFVMQSDGTEPRRLTDLDRPVRLSGVAQDGEGRTVATFDAALEGDVYRERRPYMVPLSGGPVERIHDAFGSQPHLSPDAGRLVFARGGYYDAWRRRHYRGAESSNIWLYSFADESFRQLTTFSGNEGHARWGGERTILFLSDREDRTVNLYRMSAEEGDRTLARLTQLTDDRNILDFTVCALGERAVVHVWDTLYRLDLTRPDAELEPIRITVADDETSRETFQAVDRQVSAAALSPDGQVMANVAYGQLFVRNVDDGTPTRRITRGHGRVTDLAWSPDGVHLYFTSDEDGVETISAARVRQTREEIRKAFAAATGQTTDPEPEPEAEPADKPEEETGEEEGDGTEGDEDESTDEEDGESEKKSEEDPPGTPDPKRWHDAMTFDVTPLVVRDEPSRNPSPSPCGSMLAFRGLRGHLHILDLESGDIRMLREGWDMRMHFSWSPDSRWIAFCESDLNFNADIFIVPVDGSAEAVNISRHPDNESSPVWSADGKILAFLSDRINDEFDVWMVYLDEDIEAMNDFDRRAYHDEAAKAAGKIKPLSPDPAKQAEAREKRGEPAFTAEDLEEAWLRLRRVTSYLGSEGNLAITPGGDRIIFSGSDRMSGLHSIKWDGTDLKSLGGAASVQQVTPDGDRVVLVAGSQAATVRPSGADRKTIAISDMLRIDSEAQAAQKFLEMARGLGENYYHHSMHDLDWEAITDRYLDIARRARTNDEFIWIANQFVGELGGSHLSVRGGPSGPSVPAADRHARLGTIHAPEERGYRVIEVIPRSPAAMGRYALRAGDLITAIDFRPLDPMDSIEARLKGRAGEETAITIERTLDSGETLELTTLLVPITFGAESQLRYEAWRSENVRLVHEWSNGRLGYIHIQAMSQPALDVFERDLFAAADGRDGLVLDVRNNGGGWTADRLLASIMVTPHSSTVPRGADPAARGFYPQDRLFINRYLMPMNLVCNEKSYSNAEIISHAFRTLERGTLVGMPTHGSVISTGGWSLVDGTFVRLPFRGWYLADGTDRDMELNGAEPHIMVPQTPEDEIAGLDRQLRVAVEDLMKRLE